MSILYVDDDLLVRHTALMVLEEAGYDVLEAGSVSEAMTLIERHSSDLTHVLTDVRMPGWQDGVDLAEIVADGYPHIKVVVLSGYTDRRMDALEQNAQFVAKPWTMKQMLSVVGFEAAVAVRQPPTAQAGTG